MVYNKFLSSCPALFTQLSCSRSASHTAELLYIVIVADPEVRRVQLAFDLVSIHDLARTERAMKNGKGAMRVSRQRLERSKVTETV